MRGTHLFRRLITADLAAIQEEDARQANKHHYTKHAPALPLYGEDDAHRALTHFQPVGFGDPVVVAPGIDVQLP